MKTLISDTFCQLMRKAIRLFFILLLFNVFPIPVGARKHHGKHHLRGRQEAEALKREFRQAPICVDEENKAPYEEGLARFTWIFQFYKHNTYIPVSDGKTSPTGMITRFDISPIKIDDKDSGYEDVLKNWVHIDMEAAVDIEGLYVQAISVPWGIPFGEFVANFDCKDCVGSKTSDFADKIHLIPCSKRAALSYTHPNVFTVGGDPLHEDAGGKRVFFSRIHFNFKYTQFPCVDHTYAQFLVIAVRSFKGNYTRFETFYSQVYELDVLDNKIGAYYPFYGGWDTSKIKCHDKSATLSSDFKPYAGADKRLKLRYSQNFDGCSMDTHRDNLVWFTCLPGPTIMNDADVPTDDTEWKNWRNKYDLKGDPAIDLAYGENAQFCYDSGVWDWTVGEVEWPVPSEIVLVVDEDSISLNTTIEAEKPSLNGFTCEESDSTIVCTSGTTVGKDCTDYHYNDCDQFDLEKYNITPLFGKYKDGGAYALSGVPCRNLTFTEQIDVIGIGWGNRWILILHGKLMIFTWTVAWNIVAFTARFMKEYSVLEKRSSYFGIGNWLWHHMMWTYIAWMTMFSGMYLMAHQHQSIRKEIGKPGDTASDNIHDLCNLHTDPIETGHCMSSERKIHNRLGVAACFFFFLSYVSGWGRPVNRFLRILLICYHYGMAYVGKLLFYAIMFLGYFSELDVIHEETVFSVLLVDACAVGMFIIATVYNFFIDRKFAVKGRLMCPIPEGLDIYDFPPRMQRVISLILPVHILIQLVCFFVIQGTFETEKNLCKVK